jgi:uncharacterized membrane protein
MNEWVDTAISTLLRVGVIVSVSVIAIGLVLTLRTTPETLTQLTAVRAHYPNTLPEVIDGVRHMRGEAIVMAGLLLLIATPIARVALSIVIFVIERDRLYTAITVAVLLILLIGFVLGMEGA